MSEVVGKTATVKIGGNVIVGIKSWTIDFGADVLDKTDFQDGGHRSFLAGLDGWTGSFEGYGQPGWSLSCNVGSTYGGSFYVDKVGGSYYSGSIIITGAHPAVTVDGLDTISYDFQGTGALVYT